LRDESAVVQQDRVCVRACKFVQVRNVSGTTATQGAINTDFVGLELNAQAFIGAAASGAPMHFHQVS
jgi:hypothetical protein